MKTDQLSFRPGFRLSVGNARSQAAVMVLPAGGKEGDSDNNPRGADQWLFVVEGTGAAIINGRKTILKAGRWCSSRRATAMQSATPGARC